MTGLSDHDGRNAQQIDGRIGIWTEFVHGSTLQHHLDTRGPMPVAEAMAVGRVLCAALAAIHEAGVVHGDVKAQNVLREPGGRLVLVDLGTGREHLQGVGATGGPISGTPLYMAPELWRDELPTPQSDVYSLGVLLYFLVSGAHPIAGTTAAEVRDAHGAGRHVPLRDRGLRLPAAFTAAIERALAADAALRFQDTEEFAAALNVAPVAGARRRSMAAAIAVLFIVSLAAAGYFGLWSARQESGSSAARDTTTRLEPPPALMRGRPARNGRDFPYLDLQRNLTLWDREANTSTVVVKHGDDPEVADWYLASPDGQQIVYKSGTVARGYELRIVNRDGAGSRAVLARGAAPDFQPMDWSWDNRYILCWLDRSGGIRDLALIPAAGGSPQILQQVRTGLHAGASVSPDFSYVVYEALQNQTGTRRQLLIAATQPGAPARVLRTDGTDDHNPHWTTNGDLLFASVRDRQTSLYLMPMANGVPSGPAMPVAENLNFLKSRGLSQSGILFYDTLRAGADVFTAPVDLSRESSIGSPVPIDPDVPGSHSNGRWSPNGGRRFAYIDHAYSLLLIKDILNGPSTTTIRPELSGLGTEPPMWSPDERYLLVRATGLDNRGGFFRIAVSSGKAELILQFDDPNYGRYEWLADGRGIRYRHPRGVEDRVIESGKASLVVGQKELGEGAGFGTSPDGRLLLVGIKEKDKMGVVIGVVLKLWDLAQRSTPPKIVARLGADARFVAWAPDGKRVLYVDREKPDLPFQLRIVPLDGGPARNLGALPGYTLVNPHVALHPNGHELTYMQGKFGSAMYMLENFLR
jgi:Tol biopolymer transport system component